MAGAAPEVADFAGEIRFSSQGTYAAGAIFSKRRLSFLITRVNRPKGLQICDYNKTAIWRFP